jgi:hypothetical protein
MLRKKISTVLMKVLNFVLFLSILNSSLSARFQLDVSGISVHFGPGPESAPRKLDEGGIFVFNPGLGATYDFRLDSKTSGFSFLVNGIFFRDCADRNMFTLGAGVRGRLMFSNSISGDINLIPSLALIEGEPEYIKSFLPVITAGLNYHFTQTVTAGLTFAFVPSFNDQQSNLGFFVFNISF